MTNRISSSTDRNQMGPIVEDIYLAPNLSRRPARNSLIAGSIIVGAVLADLASHDLLWERGSTEIIADSQSDNELNPNRWIAVPGIGQQSGEFIQAHLRESYFGPVDFVKLAGGGINEASIGMAMADYFENRKENGVDPTLPQDAIFSSMGLPTYLVGAQWCFDRNKPIPAIGRGIAFSSPLHSGHTSMERQIKIMNRVSYRGGPLTKFLGESYYKFQEAKFRASAIGRSVLYGIQTSYNGFPPALWASQVRLLGRSRSIRPSTLDRLITGDTTIVHVGDESDIWVRIQAAREEIAEQVTKRGGRFVIVDRPGTGHANVEATKYSAIAALDIAA